MKNDNELSPHDVSTLIVASGKFRLGLIVCTPGALEALRPLEITSFLQRHANGDWGDCCAEDKDSNDYALIHGLRLFSVYHTAQRIKIWLITEADRSVTTFLLPSEY